MRIINIPKKGIAHKPLYWLKTTNIAMAQNFQAVSGKTDALVYVSIKILERNSLWNFITADTILSAWKKERFSEIGVVNSFETSFFIQYTGEP
jgi:hypothetical protein